MGVQKAGDEKDCIEIRYGADIMRLLALGKDNQGALAGLCQKLAIKDDVLRVVGRGVEVMLVELEE